MHFRCRACGARITENLDEVRREYNVLADADAWVEGVNVVHASAQVGDEGFGCCGPTGEVPNLRCANAHLVGRYAYDCVARYTGIALDPALVALFDNDDEVGPLIGVFEGRDPRAFRAWLHAQLGAERWYGEDLLGLFAAWARAPTVGGLIVWSGASPDDGAALRIADDFRSLEHHAPRLVLMVPT